MGGYNIQGAFATAAAGGGGATTLIGKFEQNGADTDFEASFTEVDLTAYDIIGNCTWLSTDADGTAHIRFIDGAFAAGFKYSASQFVNAYGAGSTGYWYGVDPDYEGAPVSGQEDVAVGTNFHMTFLLTDSGNTARNPMYFQSWWGNYKQCWGVGWDDTAFHEVDHCTVIKSAASLENAEITLWKRART